MTILFDGVPVQSPASPSSKNTQAVVFASPAEAHEHVLEHYVDFPDNPQPPKSISHFESRQGMDYIFLNVPSIPLSQNASSVVEIYLSQNLLLFITEDDTITHSVIKKIQEQSAPAKVQQILFWFFDSLTSGDSFYLTDIEDEIVALEDSLVDVDPDTPFPTIISRLRRQLLALKRHYESLFDLLEDLEENENKLFTKSQLQYCHILTNRADRLLHSALNLHDYVTQVREAYKSQLDINLNKTMKFFTMLTAIFSPLTLIAGWYGMNLMMPELRSPWVYPFIIILSLFIIVGCLFYFKRKKWF